MKLIALLATDDYNGLGKDNKLAWHCPEDLKIFKEKTENHIIIMGRKTLESLPKGKPLPNRTNVVLTRKTPQNPIEGVVYVNSVEEALEYCKDAEVAYVIGGAQIYEAFGKYCDEMHETNIEGNHSCNVFADFVWEHTGEFSIEEVIPDSFKNEGCIAQSITILKKKEGK